ncbi:ABC transporter ATP-binding protein [Sphingomicrobium marinum]|uniref:ABC transporter ATP-binding protein n=1 Tax=Sphingomicrobium marinum TaxID=1227950 RepID=UPI00223FBCE5|nr:ABC transporter ATP-binding protein [Sphingomicrobium marinum]
MIGQARALLSRLAVSAGWRLWLLLTLMLASAAAETIGILSIVPLVGAALEAGSFPVLGAIGLSLEQALLLFLGAMGLRIGLGWWRDRLSASIGARFEAELGARVARSLVDAPFADFAVRGRGDIQSLLGFDTPRAAAAADQLLALGVTLALLLVAGAAAAWLAPVFTLAVLVGVALLVLLSVPRWRRARANGQAIAALHVEQDEMAQRLFGAIKAAKAQASGTYLANAYRQRLLAMAAREQRLLHYQADGRALVLLVSAIVAAGLVLVGTRVLGMDIVTLGASLILYARLAQPAQALHRIIDTLSALLPSFARIRPLLATVPSSAPTERGSWQQLSARRLVLAHEDPLFDPVDIDVAPGEWVAITGPSGIGKTTLVDAFAGLQMPSEGAIEIDGGRLSARADWPLHIAYVVQSDLVYHDTIAANLDPEGKLDAATLQRICDCVGLDHSLDAQVVELGSGLSGGERQRLLIGRALCRRPTLLLLDEALGALDDDAARTLVERIRMEFPDIAAVLVTHRMSLANQCDRRIALGKSTETT